MVTFEEIKNDLIDIKFYYIRKKSMDEAFRSLGYNSVIKKVEKYNELIKSAPPQLYDLYVQLYINHHTQESYADLMGYTREYITKVNKRLVHYFLNLLKDDSLSNEIIEKGGEQNESL